MLEYRREIDGLRSVAVIPVIRFHAGFQVFGGGYVGVDVFFVISGYLITSILVDQLGTGRFSLLQFYERRARRILPALFLVVACSTPFAIAWMRPVQLLEYARSLGAVTLFSSNILFWLESDYFAPAADEKPLLHTWSLAVEEQYYLVFPLLMLAVFGLGRRRIAITLSLLAVASLAGSEVVRLFDPTANYYLAPTRFWEILLGALTALAVQAPIARWPRIAEAASLSGASLILAAVFLFDAATPFPGLFALVPTLGTVLVIAFASPATVTGRVLGARWVVGIGLISYSAYLWHQPLLAFARIRTAGAMPVGLATALVVTTFVLAGASWYWVERPFRDRRRVSTRAVFASAAVAASTWWGSRSRV